MQSQQTINSYSNLTHSQKYIKHKQPISTLSQHEHNNNNIKQKSRNISNGIHDDGIKINNYKSIELRVPNKQRYQIYGYLNTNVYRSIDVNRIKKVGNVQKTMDNRYHSIYTIKNNIQPDTSINYNHYKKHQKNRNNMTKQQTKLNIKPKSQKYIINNKSVLNSQQTFPTHQYSKYSQPYNPNTFKSKQNNQNNQLKIKLTPKTIQYQNQKYMYKQQDVKQNSKSKIQYKFKRKLHDGSNNNNKIKLISSARQLSTIQYNQRGDQKNMEGVDNKCMNVQSARINTEVSKNNNNSNNQYINKALNTQKIHKKSRRHLTQICNNYRNNLNQLIKTNKNQALQSQLKPTPNPQKQSYPHNQQHKHHHHIVVRNQIKTPTLKQQIADISQIMQQNKYGISNQHSSILENIGQLDIILSDFSHKQQNVKLNKQQSQRKSSLVNCNGNGNVNLKEGNKRNIQIYQCKQNNYLLNNKAYEKTVIKTGMTNLFTSLATLPYTQSYIPLQQKQKNKSQQSQHYIHPQHQQLDINMNKSKNNSIQKSKNKNKDKMGSNYKSSININLNKLKQMKQYRTNVLVLKSIDRIKHAFPKGFF